MDSRDLQELRGHLDSRIDILQDQLTGMRTTLDKLDNKLDRHSDRITSNETDITWLKGSVRFGMTLLTALVTSVIGLFITGK